jgi:hypothetical protein
LQASPSTGSVVSVRESLGTGRTKPLSSVLKLLEVMMKEMGESGQDLLMKHFPQE